MSLIFNTKKHLAIILLNTLLVLMNYYLTTITMGISIKIMGNKRAIGFARFPVDAIIEFQLILKKQFSELYRKIRLSQMKNI